MKKIEYFLFVIYKIVFDIIYIDIVSVIFEYMGMYKDINFFKYFCGWALFLIIIYIIQRFFKNTIYLYINKLLLIFSIMPQISIWGIKNYSSIAMIYIIVYWFFFIFTLKLLEQTKFLGNKHIKINNCPKKIINNKISSNLFLIILLLFTCLVVIYVSWKYTGLRFTLSLADVYEFRKSYALADKSILVKYLLTFSSVILPYCFMIYILEKKYIVSVIIFLIGVIAFSINGMKTWLFIYLSMIFLCMFGKSKKIGIISYLLILLIGITILSGVIYYRSGDITLVGLQNRMLCYPSELNFYYYNFFTGNEKLYLRESFLRNIFASPYYINTPYLIAYEYGGGTGYTNNAVNGLFGDAYANFGIIGVILYPILFSTIMKVVSDLCQYYKDNRYAFCVMFILIWNSINTSFFTWLLTGGVLLLIVILIINNKSKVRLKIK